jgi:hypothetical protein
MPATLEPPVDRTSTPPADFDAAFPDDGLDNPTPAPAPEAKPDAKVEPEPTTETPTPEAKAEPKPDTKPEIKADVKEPETEFEPPKVGKPSDLRSFATRMGQRAKKAETEIATLRKEVEQLKAAPRKTEDNSAVVQELAAAKKRLEQYESDLQLTKYERSEDYKSKYQQPYQTAVQRAYKEVKELLAYDPNPDDPENPKERMATAADFDEIYQLPTGQAIKLAKQRFGDAAMTIIGHRSKIRELAEAAYTAVEEHKGKATEIETRTKAEQEQRERAMSTLFEKAAEFHTKKNPELFLPRDGDNEGNELLAKGKAFASAVFGGNEGLNPVQIAQRDAVAFNRLTGYPRLQRDFKKAKADLAEALKTIDTIRGSGPGKPTPAAAGKTEPSYKPASEAFDEMVK